MISLINPNLVLQRSDIFTTGVVYMPVALSYFAGFLQEKGVELEVIDAFGEKPMQYWEEEGYVYRGMSSDEVLTSINCNTKAFVFYAINLTYHQSLINLIRQVKGKFPEIPIVVMENSQAVTAYSLRRIQAELHEAGVDYILTGDAEHRGLHLISHITAPSPEHSLDDIDGIGYLKDNLIHYAPSNTKIKNLDELPLPAWSLFPLENYWKLGYAHGPTSAAKYLPLLTSRGCPYRCGFCVVPETNDVKWRFRSAKNVVDEIEAMVENFGVREFHIEDLNPTIMDKRTQAISQEILDRNLKVRWKICAGTKVESIKSTKTIEMMAHAGCSYISISPESGSSEVMKSIDKPFNYDHAVDIIRAMNKNGIYSQACFVLGFPGEKIEDRAKTRKMIHDLTKAGVDEIAQFIVTPVPGSRIFDKLKGYSHYSQLNFSPDWREDYEELNRFRIKLYREFLFWKLKYHPIKVISQCFRFITGRFQTKMEMVPFRALKTAMMLRRLGGKKIESKNWPVKQVSSLRVR